MTGRPRVHHRATDSTNERAKQLARRGAPHGTLVTADLQSAGRGRHGREWTAPAGSAVLMSVVLRDLGEAQELLPLAAAVAVCEAAEALAPLRCEVKWPNDVWVDGLKLAGILIEGRPQEGWAVLGIGLNVATEQFPPEIAGIATSIAIAAPGQAATPGRTLEELLRALDRRLADTQAEILAAWRERDALRDSAVRWADGEGTAAGIDDSGSLLVITGSGTLALHAGEVHLLRD